MIIDHLSQLDRYESLHPGFKEAFAYVRSLKSENLIDKEFFHVSNNLRAMIASVEGIDKSAGNPEAHNKHIDVQICYKGKETFGWKHRKDCIKPKAEYSDEKDVIFFEDEPSLYFDLPEMHFVILFPNDVHAPTIGNGLIKKVVVKVKV